MALGMTLIIITGGIDLSVGSNLALVSVAVGFTFAAGLPLPLAILFGLVVGMAAGVLQQRLYHVPGPASPRGNPRAPSPSSRGWPRPHGGAGGLGLSRAGSRTSGRRTCSARCPASSFIFVVAVVVVWVILSRTSFGRYVYAIGNNEEAARFSGVPIRRVKVAIYAGTGLLVAVAAVIYTSRVYTARGDVGLGLELDVISAVVLGGASIYGGSGTIAGTVLGVVIIAILRNGLLLAGVPSTWQLFILGVCSWSPCS